tara:strand:- start:26 stop:589 length:564 start_codon:yes stop_codon:yes gene_type:complete
MNKKFYVTLFYTFLVVGCNESKNSELELPKSVQEPVSIFNLEYNKTKEIHYTTSSQEKPYTGPVLNFHQNNKVWMKGTLVNGKWDGDWYHYNENGTLHEKRIFSDGLMLSSKYIKYTIYDEIEFIWEESFLDGDNYLSSRHFENGMIKHSISSKNGLRHGLQKVFEDGKIVYEENYKDGELIDSKKY